MRSLRLLLASPFRKSPSTIRLLALVVAEHHAAIEIPAKDEDLAFGTFAGVHEIAEIVLGIVNKSDAARAGDLRAVLSGAKKALGHVVDLLL